MSDDLAFHVLLRSEQTDGHVSLVENTVPPHWEGTPLHHDGFDEAWYVLTGPSPSSSATTS